MVIGLWLLFAIFSFLDIFLTYKVFKKARKLGYEADFQEFNPLARFLWAKYGLLKGSIISGFYTIPFMSFFVYLLENNKFFGNVEKFNFMAIGVLFGVYFFVIHTHIYHLKGMKNGRNRDKK